MISSFFITLFHYLLKPLSKSEIKKKTDYFKLLFITLILSEIIFGIFL